MCAWNVLVVDDEILNLEIIGEYLHGGPYQLTMATNGEEAWNKLAQPDSAFDVVILDRMMPVMDGMELLRRIKEDAGFTHIPVIMQTAATTPAQIREGLAAGCYYYLTKPYRMDALLSIVNTVLDDLRKDRLLLDASRTPAAVTATVSTEYTFATLEEAQRLATLLAAQCPEPAKTVMGLSELLVNAIEHGNLGISYAEKSRLKQQSGWEQEIERRLQLPENRNRKAVVSFTRTSNEIIFTITDQGAGFSWEQYLDFDSDRVFDPNGRGIAMAGKISFSRLMYQEKGNSVIAAVKLE